MLEYLGIASIVCGSDLVIKETVKDKVRENSKKYVLNDKIILTKFYNPGAALGALKNQQELLHTVTVLGVGGLYGALAMADMVKGHRLQKIGLSMMLGGASSNAYERLRYGKVTDYIRFNTKNKKLRNVVYNLGDFAIFAGTAMLMAGELLDK